MCLDFVNVETCTTMFKTVMALHIYIKKSLPTGNVNI